MANGSGFAVDQVRSAGSYPNERAYAAASTQYQQGDMVLVSNGVANFVTAAGKGSHIVASMETLPGLIRPGTLLLSTTAGEKLLLIPVRGNGSRLQSRLTVNSVPPFNGAACQTNSTANQVKVTSGSGSNGDYVGGTIWIPEFGTNPDIAQRIITASTFGAGAYTFTVNFNFGQPAVGLTTPSPLIASSNNTATVVPFSKGSSSAVKFAATNPQQGISTALADIAGGTNYIEDVDLPRGLVFTSLPYFV